MQPIPLFKIHDANRPPLFVHLDGDKLEIRREGRGPLDEIRAELTSNEGRELQMALGALLRKPEHPETGSEVQQLATRLRDSILNDAIDRHGWREEWGQFPQNLRDEISGTWLALIEAALAYHDP